MDKKFFSYVSYISIVAFLCILILPTVLSFFVDEDPDYILEEKRELAEFPSVHSDSFIIDLEAWYADHIPFRMTLITFLKEQTKTIGNWYRAYLHPFISYIFTPEWYNKSNGLEGEKYLAPIEEDGAVYGRDGWLFFSDENNLDYYKGTNLLDSDILEEWKNVYQELNNVCLEKGIRLIVVIAPNKEQVYSEYVPSYYISNEQKREQLLANEMIDSGVFFLYPLQELLASKSSYPVYYKQDTHWTSCGAFICTQQIFQEMGIEWSDEDLQITNTIKTGGDLSNLCGFSSEYEDVILTYKPDIQPDACEYDGFTIHQNSLSENGSLVLIGDSFRNALADIIIKEFSSSMIARRNRIEEPLVQRALLDLHEGDTLLLEAVERYDKQNEETAQYIIDLLQ